MASAFKTFPAVLPAKDLDYGLELAVRRRRTKSLQGEDQLRKKLIASLYAEHAALTEKVTTPTLSNIDESNKNSPAASNDDIESCLDTQCPLSVMSNRTMSDIGTYEDWFGSEVVVPRDTDRILEQFVLMLLRIGAFLKKEHLDLIRHFNSNSQPVLPRRKTLKCTAMPSEETDTPPLVGSSKGRMASYLRDYPHIFMKKPSDIFGTLNTPENRFPVAKSSSSSQSEKSVIEEIIVPKLNNGISKKISSGTLIHSPEEINERYAKSFNKRVENLDKSIGKSNEQFSNNLQSHSCNSIESVINRMKIRAASKEENKDKVNKKITEGSLQLNKYKRKATTSSNDNNDFYSERSSKISKHTKSSNRNKKS